MLKAVTCLWTYQIFYARSMSRDDTTLTLQPIVTVCMHAWHTYSAFQIHRGVSRMRIPDSVSVSLCFLLFGGASLGWHIWVTSSTTAPWRLSVTVTWMFCVFVGVSHTEREMERKWRINENEQSDACNEKEQKHPKEFLNGKKYINYEPELLHY